MHTTAASPKTATKTLSNAFLKKKQHGEKIEVPKERAPAKVVNLMEALRRSIDAEGGRRKPAARSVQHRSGAKKRRADQARANEKQVRQHRLSAASLHKSKVVIGNMTPMLFVFGP